MADSTVWRVRLCPPKVVPFRVTQDLVRQPAAQSFTKWHLNVTPEAEREIEKAVAVNQKSIREPQKLTL
jgi:hypothetical protein